MNALSPQDKAKQIKLLALDVDGTLTSGLIYYGPNEAQWRGFHVHDGLGIKLLQRAGIIVAIISAKQSDSVLQRLKELKIEHYYLGQQDKRIAYDDLKNKLKIEDEQIAYMGDDLPDLPLLRRAGFSITLPDAPVIIKQQVDWISSRQAGMGAVREACEFILTAQNQYDAAISSYLT
jgi:3-deoxy-D-manno-octulosonate 8-phosphate phosphatase (KDO 8-P phosphatase)